MKYDLAASILRNTLEHWSTVKMDEEIKDIQIISEIKYDDYQQYTHGMRYVESLALWMRQFESCEDRDCAYDLVKKQLIYISEEEMRQLVSYAFSISMKKYLMKITREFCEANSIMTEEERKDIYKYYRRSSLFLGLSDGAHMDYFRRQNSELSNEQVFVHYDFSKSKASDMNKNLVTDELIKRVQKKYSELGTPQFNSVFLLDDFSGSGKSYIRRDDKGIWHGKIKKFFDQLKELGFEYKDVNVHLVLYVSTDESIENIRKNAKEYTREIGAKDITIDAIQKVYAIDWNQNEDLKDMLKRNYDKLTKETGNTFVDKHFKVGEGKEPYLGFGDCSLPLVLYHNTPNNSLPVLWYSWGESVDALFMRITRHKES